MFKLHRHRSSDRSFGERFDFRFCNFRAVQVPVVSERLFLSIVSVDTGKTIAKSSKAPARSGICQWPDSILEPIWFSRDEVSKEFDECQYKIVVSMGSIKTGILGEIFLNLANFLNLVDPTAISLPLKRCNSGTVLQLKVQCLGTKSKLSGLRSSKDMPPRLDDRCPINDDMDNRSDGSDSVINRSVRSSSGNPLGGTYQDESGNRETSYSASGSHRSSNSGDSTVDRTNLSPRDNSNGGLYVGRQDSASSYVSAGRGDEGFRSNNSSFSSRASGPNMLQGNTPKSFANGIAQSSLGTSDSSKDLLEAAEETIEELRDEAKMWERHSRKLKADLQALKKECSEKSRQQAELAVELSAAHAERDSYRQEIEELKSSRQEGTSRQQKLGTPKRGDWIDLQKELEDDMKFLKESNANLAVQLKNTQEANIELVSILQELEETIEEQRAEISKISKVKDVSDPDVLRNGLLVKEDTEWARKLSMKEDEITMLREKLDRVLNIGTAGVAGSDSVYLELEKENETLRVKIQELEKDCSELTDENLELIYKLKENGVAKGLNPRNSNNSELQIEKLTSQIHQLEEELRNKEMFHTGSFTEASMSNTKELQKKCAHLELKLLNFRSQTCELEEKFQKSQEELEQRNLELSNLRQKLEGFHSTELECCEIGGARGYQFRREDLEDGGPASDMLKTRVQLQQQENDDLRRYKVETEIFISEIQAEKSQLEERLAASLKESSITSKCVAELQQDILVLSSSIDSHVSANKVLERKIIELESCKAELELHISELEQENIELSERISGLEAQLSYMTNEKESSELQMHDSKSLVINLKDKVERQQVEMDAQRLEFKQKQQEAQRKLTEAQDDSEVLRRSNTNLQSTVENLIEECSSLQNLTADLKRQKLELHGRFMQQEQELDNSKKRNFDFCKTVEFLEAKLSSIQKDISSKEQSLLSELENIFQEHMEQEERINRAHFMLNKIEKEKTLEVENLEREVMSLTAQVSSTHEERGNAAVDAIREVSILRADKAKFEANYQNVTEQLSHCESQLEDLRKESKSKIKGLVDSLNASKQSEEMLTADAEHMKKLMEAAKSSEDESRKTSGELELELKSSDYEKQQMMEEISGLKLQVQKIMSLQDEISKLRSSLDDTKFEKGKLEEVLQSVNVECEELKAQKAMLTDKVSDMQETLNNGEEEKRNRRSMEAKLVRLESDLSASEASHVHEAELKNELSRIRRSNSEYQRKIQSLEQENEDLTRRIQVMEKGLEQMCHIKEENLGNQEVGDCTVNEETVIQSKIQLLETKLAEALEENKMYRDQQKSPMPEGESAGGDCSNDRILQLEGDLRDMRERLLNMSLEYAEVEAQREKLVMELKAIKKGRWF